MTDPELVEQLLAENEEDVSNLSQLRSMFGMFCKCVSFSFVTQCYCVVDILLAFFVAARLKCSPTRLSYYLLARKLLTSISVTFVVRDKKYLTPTLNSL